MADYRVISSDNHIVEPPDLWADRIAPEFRDRCPCMKDTGMGPFWFVDNMTFLNNNDMGSQPGRRFDETDKLLRGDDWENVRLGGYIGEEATKDMDIDGVDVGLVYPTLTIFMYPFVEDSKLLTAIFRAYNDFAAEFCQANPRRLKAIAVINIDDVEDGVQEIERCAKLGFAGATIPEYVAERGYNLPEYNPLWACAQDLDMPLSLHIFTPRVKAGRGWDRDLFDPFHSTNLLLDNADFWVRVSISEMILSGVFDRYPKLKVGVAEHELNWVPYYLERTDYSYTQRATGRQGYQLEGGMLPSDVFHRNCFVDFQEDVQGIKNRDMIGVDNILWGSDYPHTESTWPKSREFIEETLAECTEEEKAKIVGGNSARIYGI
jgi:predicted TIM-barrel fold metal-dependent hydrolase